MNDARNDHHLGRPLPSAARRLDPADLTPREVPKTRVSSQGRELCQGLARTRRAGIRDHQRRRSQSAPTGAQGRGPLRAGHRGPRARHPGGQGLGRCTRGTGQDRQGVPGPHPSGRVAGLSQDEARGHRAGDQGPRPRRQLGGEAGRGPAQERYGLRHATPRSLCDGDQARSHGYRQGRPAGAGFHRPTSDGKPFKLSSVLGKKPIAIYFAAYDG